METRLINQVVEWEWKSKLENEKKNIHRSESYPYLPIAFESSRKAVKSTLRLFKRLGHNRSFSIHSSETA